MTRDDHRTIHIVEEAIEVGIEAAAEYASSLPLGRRAWAEKEFGIAETAARHAVKSFSIAWATFLCTDLPWEKP